MRIVYLILIYKIVFIKMIYDLGFNGKNILCFYLRKYFFQSFLFKYLYSKLRSSAHFLAHFEILFELLSLNKTNY